MLPQANPHCAKSVGSTQLSGQWGEREESAWMATMWSAPKPTKAKPEYLSNKDTSLKNYCLSAAYIPETE